MRVLFLTEERISFTDSLVRGGAIHVRNVVSGLRERGHDVTLLDWNPDPERPFQESIMPASRFVDGAVRTLARALSVGRRSDPDVVVSKTRKTYLPGLVAANRLGVPHVVHVGSSLDRPTGGLLDRASMASFEARLRAPHDAYFVVCDHIAAQLRDRSIDPSKIYDVRNAVDTQRFHPSGLDTPLAEERASMLPADGFVVGYVGGLQPYKGVGDLARAVELADIDCHVVVAGEGPERQRLARAFGEAGTFLGSVPYAEIPALYHAMDAFVLPSHTEGLPRVVLEAQATGTPVVATRVGGVPEVVTDGETGLLCEPGDAAALAAHVETLAGDPETRARLGDNGRRAVEADFEWADMYDRYERFLTAVVGDG